MRKRPSRKKPTVKKGLTAADVILSPFTMLWGAVKIFAALGGAKIKK